jgi:hypothetical protein
VTLALLLAATLVPAVEGVALAGRFTVAGRACPVGQRVALTNAHVIDERPFESSVPAYPMRWSDADGNTGRVAPHQRGLSRIEDLAYLVADRPFARWYRIATETPKPGDEVTLTTPRWGGRGRVLETEAIVTRVARVVAGHLELREGGRPGSSGGCVLNAAGELVAINMAMLPVDGNMLRPAGWAVGVWGDWLAPGWEEIGWSPADGAPAPPLDPWGAR